VITGLLIGLAVWVLLSIPAALGVGRALHNLAARQTTAPASAPKLRAVS
jgi:hypothetical protein